MLAIESPTASHISEESEEPEPDPLPDPVPVPLPVPVLLSGVLKPSV